MHEEAIQKRWWPLSEEKLGPNMSLQHPNLVIGR